MVQKVFTKGIVSILLISVLLLTLSTYCKITFEPYRSLDCAGIICKEGQFCQNNRCHSSYVPANSEPIGYY